MIQPFFSYILKEFIKTLNYHSKVALYGRTISDEYKVYRKICNVCKRIFEEDPDLAKKFNQLSDTRKELFYAKLVFLVSKDLRLPITTSWYLRGPMPSVHQMAMTKLQTEPLHGAQANPKLFSEVKKRICLLDGLGIFEAESFLINFYREFAPERLRDLYLAKEDLIREPNNENFSRFEAELSLLQGTLQIEPHVFDLLLEFGMLYSSLNDIGLQEKEWLMTYRKVISQYVAIYSMQGPRRDEEIKKKKNQLPKDIRQLKKTIEYLKTLLSEKENAEKLHRTATVEQDAAQLLS